MNWNWLKSDRSVRKVGYYLALINCVISIVTWGMITWGALLLECNWTANSGSVHCNNLGVFSEFFEALYGFAVVSFTYRIMTLGILDFWALYFLITRLDGVKS